MSIDGKALFRKYLNDDLSADELSRFYEMVKAGKIDPAALEEVLDEMMEQPGFMMEGGGEDKRVAWASILAKIDLEKRNDEGTKIFHWRGRRSFLKWGAVAAVATGLLLGSYLIRYKDHAAESYAKKEKPDMAPGKSGAVLTLADGSQVELDSTGNGTVNIQGNTTLLKQDGKLTYRPGSGSDQTLLFNTLATPKGRQFQVKLSDGTLVWLNAGSSIRYPIAFGSKERVVEVSGEAYFEVGEDPKRPFSVKAGQTEVEVLGTHFDVNSYDDEPALKATLLEGRIKISAPHASKLLIPGQQAQLQETGGISVVDNVDPGDVVAWKDGIFQFDESDIHTVMRQLARWYDIDVQYQGSVAMHFGGSISRNVNLSKVLEMLQKTGAVSFEIRGKTVIVRG